jgi:polyisoprenoid-binding protein YceI
METLIRCVLGLAALVASGVDAETTCYTGGADSGELTFQGAVEGTGFTGRFGAFDVQYCMPPGEPAAGRIRVGVQLASADTDNDDRDQTLKGPEFFAVEQHPRAEWSSGSIAADGGGYRAAGDLTLKGITKTQAVQFTLEADGDGLMARGGFTLAGSADVDRQRFDVGTGEFADPEFVRNRVDVAFEVRLTSAD